jgi:peptide/nickel transport system permease protein
MLKYIIKRLALSVLILFCVSLIIFTLIQLMPMDYVTQQIAAIETKGEAVSEETVQALMSEYGYGTDGTFGGIVRGYFTWLRATLRLDFGNSFKFQQPVADVIAKNMWVSFAVAAIATVFEFTIAIPLGITAATHQYSFRDYFVTVLVMIGISLPSFFFGQILKNMLAMQLGWFPSSGLGSASMDYSGIGLILDYLSYLVIPVLTVVVLSIGGRMRMTRTNMLEVLNSDYIRTARAKGLHESKVIYKHAFRNTLIPLVTSLAGLLPSLFSGAIITEQVFGLPGIGNMAYQATLVADIPFIMGYNLFLAVLSIVGVLLADIMYAVVDPRVKLG